MKTMKRKWNSNSFMIYGVSVITFLSPPSASFLLPLNPPSVKCETKKSFLSNCPLPWISVRSAERFGKKLNCWEAITKRKHLALINFAEVGADSALMCDNLKPSMVTTFIGIKTLPLLMLRSDNGVGYLKCSTRPNLLGIQSRDSLGGLSWIWNAGEVRRDKKIARGRFFKCK